MKIEVKSSAVETRSGVSKQGKPYSVRNQNVYWHKTGEPYPFKVQISLEDGQEPYSPGFYTLSESSYKIGRFGDLEIDRFNLKLIPAPVSAASARSASA